MKPEPIWRLSRFLYRRGSVRLARIVKAINFVMFRAVLPPEAVVGEGVRLGHYGAGIVVHPNVTIGRNVHLWHGVTLAVSDSPGTSSRVVIGEGCELGANVVVISRERESLTIVPGTRIGANAVVSRSICEPGTYVGVPARRIR